MCIPLKHIYLIMIIYYDSMHASTLSCHIPVKSLLQNKIYPQQHTDTQSATAVKMSSLNTVLSPLISLTWTFSKPLYTVNKALVLGKTW